MIEIKSSKKCCKCFREENALLHLIWILLCSIESPPFLSYEESAGWDGGAAEHVVLVTDCSTAAAPGPGQWRACSGVAVLQQRSLQPYYDTTTTAAPLTTLLQVVTLQPGWVYSSLIWTLVYIDILNIRRRLLLSSQNLHQQAVWLAMFLKTAH